MTRNHYYGSVVEMVRLTLASGRVARREAGGVCQSGVEQLRPVRYEKDATLGSCIASIVYNPFGVYTLLLEDYMLMTPVGGTFTARYLLFPMFRKWYGGDIN